MSDLSSPHHAPTKGRSVKSLAVKAGIGAAGTACLALTILLGILFPSDLVLAVATAILAAANVALAVTQWFQRRH
jgi:hypothetical protein